MLDATNIKIGSKLVGEGKPCYVIAEAGSNHNGDLTIAKELIDELAIEKKIDRIIFFDGIVFVYKK